MGNVIEPRYLLDLPEMERMLIPQDFLDLMGHMNVMWYTHLFSNATVRLFEQIGLSLDYMKAHQAGSFALEVHVRYYGEVLAGQEVIVRTRILGRTEKRFHIMHFMTIGDEALSCTSEFVSAYMDLSVRRMAPMPPLIAGALDRLIEQHAALPWKAPVCGVMRP